MLKVAGKSMPVQTVGKLRDMQERSRNARDAKGKEQSFTAVVNVKVKTGFVGIECSIPLWSYHHRRSY